MSANYMVGDLPSMVLTLWPPASQRVRRGGGRGLAGEAWVGEGRMASTRAGPGMSEALSRWPRGPSRPVRPAPTTSREVSSRPRATVAWCAPRTSLQCSTPSSPPQELAGRVRAVLTCHDARPDQILGRLNPVSS